MLDEQRNPKNPYETTETEWLGPRPAVLSRVFEERARSLLVKNDSPDLAFDWSANPYRGCEHACSYCYARPSHHYLGFGAGTDFDSKIVAKINAAELLKRELAHPQWRGDLIAFSGDTDCYQPQEAIYRLTRACLEVCVRYRNPVAIVTKSALIRRDLDILEELVRVADVRVTLSLATTDAKTARILEPHAAPPAARLATLRALREAGVPAGVLVAPIVPGLTDRHMTETLERVHEVGGQWAYPLLLRLPGVVKEVFLDRLKRDLPAAAARVEARVRDVREGQLNDSRFHHRHRGVGPYADAIMNLFQLHQVRLGLHHGAPPIRRTYLPLETQGELFDRDDAG